MTTLTPPPEIRSVADMTTLQERYRQVKERVAAAAARSDRTENDILVVAVTKTASPEQIRELVELGHADFGESKVQHLAKRVPAVEEFLERHRTLTHPRDVVVPEAVRWHMIGHLQRNKVKKCIDLVSLIHSVDTLRLAEELQEIAMKREQPVDVLLQVNASYEKDKYGVALPAALHLAEQIDTMINIRLRGLMTMAELTDDESLVRAAFERCADAFSDIRKAGIGGRHFSILSMGMSHDYELAIECGANLVRVGRAIFGTPDENESADEGSASTPKAVETEQVG